MKDIIHGYMSDRIAYQEFESKLKKAMEHKQIHCAPSYSSFWLLRALNILKLYFSEHDWDDAMEVTGYDWNP